MKKGSSLSLLLGLTLAGAFLMATTVPGTFTTDENAYSLAAIALARGEQTVPGTDGLPFAYGLRYYEPRAAVQQQPPDPPPSLTFGVPPLHAVIAQPFVWLGRWGLLLLNILSFIAAAFVVHRYTRDHSETDTGPTTALLAFCIGNFVIEYAQGVWPHMLSIALVASGAFAASRARLHQSYAAAALAGLAMGTAVGIRFQNAVLVACLPLTFFALRYWRLGLVAAAGAAPPLAAVSILRRLGEGTAHPFDRGGAYLAPQLGDFGYHRFIEPLAVFWAKVVDYSSHPKILDPLHGYMIKEPETGATLIGLAVKKAWLQSSPWVLIALLAMLLAWRIRKSGEKLSPRQRELRALSLLVFPMLAAFCVAGFSRTDGGAFNQRYFLEMTPFAAVALGLTVDGAKLQRQWILAAALVSLALVAFILPSGLEGTTKLYFMMLTPVGLALCSLPAWAMRQSPILLSIALGSTIAWGGAIHVFDDLRASRHQRSFNALRLDAMREAFVEPAAVFAFGKNKDAIGPLQFDQDLMVIETAYDEIPRLQMLAGELLARGRHVYIVANEMPEPIMRALAASAEAVSSRKVPVAGMEPLELLELTRR